MSDINTKEVGAFQQAKDRSILIVEDEPLIGIDLEDTVSEAGYRTKLLTSNEASIAWLANHTPAAAILDLKLKDGPSEKVAALLVSRNVPLVICSGSRPSDAADIFAEATWIGKPFHSRELLATIERLLSDDFVKEMEQRG
jgi:DNA-binding response OmpR family regulator